MEMIPFTYQDSPVRTVENDGHILFCGKDVAPALGYKDPTSALKLHCKGVAKHHGTTDRDNQAPTQARNLHRNR